MSNSLRILSLVFMKILPIETNWLNFLDITLPNQEMIWSASRSTLKERNKTKKIYMLLLVILELLSLVLHLLRHSEREILKLSIWLTQLMNMSSNKWRNLKDINSKIVPKKVLNSINPKMKRKKLKNKKLLLKVFASYARKFLVIRLKKFKLVKDSLNLHVLWLLVNMDGQLIWKESWKLKLLEILLCKTIWFQRRPWKSIPITQLL